MTRIVLESNTYLNHYEMHSFVALQMFAGTRSMHESVHLILIESQASLHTFQTKLLHGPSGPHSPSGLSLQFQIQVLPKSGVRNNTLKKGDQEAYPEVTPHSP
jgi:hypothetical protein